MKYLTLRNLLFVGIGGFIGGFLRFLLVELSDIFVGADAFISILIINIVACFLIAVISQNIRNHQIKLLLQTGFLGGFSTVASVMLMSIEMSFSKQAIFAIGYILITYVLAVLATLIGFNIRIKNLSK